MELTSDGRAFVYGVFGADGCECENLEGLFDSQAAAEKYIAILRSGPMCTIRGHEYANGAAFYGRADLLSWRQIEVRKP